MPSDDQLLAALRSDLVDVGFCRLPGAGPQGDARPLFLNPKGGAPAPADVDSVPAEELDPVAMLSAFASGGIAGPMYSRRRTVDLWLRGPKIQSLQQLEYAITGRLCQESPGGSMSRTNFDLGVGPEAIRVIECQEWRPAQPLEPTQGDTFTLIASYVFEIYRD